MDEHATMALMIGVSLFVIVLTLSLLVTYFNTSKKIADQVNLRVDVATNYDTIVNNLETYEQKLSGVEVRSLVRKYAGDKNVTINIISISSITNSLYRNINNVWYDEEIGMIKETMLHVINPSWENRVYKTVEDSHITLDIELDIKIELIED